MHDSSIDLCVSRNRVGAVSRSLGQFKTKTTLDLYETPPRVGHRVVFDKENKVKIHKTRWYRITRKYLCIFVQ